MSRQGSKGAIQELLDTSTAQEGVGVIQAHPELLSDEADNLFDLLTEHADESGNEELAPDPDPSFP